ncbi:hypothetical protein JK361_10140 [Streptomyces sp. 5-8]|uniref:Minor tail protein n=1 Tax=Streptomyces musisoli TaxID=2802280 RepID=A0ABS1NYV0_9ACTN|nr:hypothetical protein [Streptomyces musisoli]MBL1104950.1 hypothetical protein [Streptomyces musisoli]
MAQSSFPFGSSQIATEDQWSSMFRMAQVDGVRATDPTGTNLRVSGSNASTVAVAAGEAWIQGTYYSNSASLNVSVPTNSGGGTARNDLVVLRRDPSADSITVQYKTGGTAFPTLTQTLNGIWEIPLAQVTVAAGASVVAPAGVVDQRWFLGRPVALSNSGSRPPATKGQLIVEGKDVLLGNGVSFDLLATAGSDTGWKNVPLASGFATYSAPCSYRVKDGMVFMRGNFKKTSGDLPKNVVTKFATLPAEARPPYTRFAVTATEWNNYSVGGTSVGFFHARVEVRSDGTCWFLVPQPSSPAYCDLDSFTYSL